MHLKISSVKWQPLSKGRWIKSQTPPLSSISDIWYIHILRWNQVTGNVFQKLLYSVCQLVLMRFFLTYYLRSKLCFRVSVLFINTIHYFILIQINICMLHQERCYEINFICSNISPIFFSQLSKYCNIVQLNKSASVQAMVWHPLGTKPFPEPVLTNIHVIRPQWVYAEALSVNSLRPSDAYMRRWSNHHWLR